MAKTLQFRRYSTTDLQQIIPAQGELIVDLTQNTISVGDGTTLGGWYLATQQQLNNLSTNGIVIANTDDAVSGTTGALRVAGGVGVAGNVYIAGGLVVRGNTTIENINISSYSVNSTETIVVSNTAPSINTTTGALQVAGGVGISGNVNIGGITNINGTLNLSNTAYQNGVQIPTITTVLAYALAF